MTKTDSYNVKVDYYYSNKATLCRGFSISISVTVNWKIAQDEQDIDHVVDRK